MKFTVIRSRFLDLLSNVQSIVPGKPALLILSNALVEASAEGSLRLTATDLDMFVQATQSTDIKVDEPGATTLPVKKLVDILRMAPEGEVQFEVDGEHVTRVVTAAAKYRVMGMGSQDFPKVREPEGETHCFTIERALFREMLRKTSYAAGTDETRRTLTGVLLEFNDGKLTMVATDGKRLALVEQELEFPPESNCSMILPPKAVAELSRLLAGEGPMKIYGQAGQIVFDCGNFRFYSKLIEGAYARYQAVIPTACEERVTVMREELMTSIQRVAIMSNDKMHAVKLTFTEGALTLTASNAESGEASDVLPIKYTGRELSSTYNPTYIMDCLRALDSEEVTFELGQDGFSPSVIKSPNIPFLYVIMPLRIPV